MKLLKEITDWTASENQKNHTYILNDKSRLIGYIPFESNDTQWFKTPKSFYKSRRRFVELPQGSWTDLEESLENFNLTLRENI